MDVNEIVEESNYYPFGLKHRGYNGEVSGMPNKFLTYNGKEFEEALGLNMYEMDMRHYDAAIARWVVQDPVIHFNYSPYQAFDNNPIYWADPSGADSQVIQDLDGNEWTVDCENGECGNARKGRQAQDEKEDEDKIILKGDNKLIKRTVDILNIALDGFYQVSVSKNGELSIKETNKKGEASKEVGVIAKLLGSIIKDDKSIVIKVSEGSNKVFIGSYGLEEIDIADIEKFGNESDIQTSGGALMHEIVEQYRKQKFNDDYRIAHSKGSSAEDIINGSTRIQSQMKQSGNTLIVPYKKDGKIKYLLIQVSKNNIIKVTEK